jgi:flagellar hook-basal body complex protein FliE
MWKQVVSFSLLFLALAIAGCGGDQRESLINNTLNQITLATNTIRQIHDAVAKELKKAEDPKHNKISSTDFENIIKVEIKSYKDIGVALQGIKRDVDAIRDSITEEDRKNYREKFQSQIQPALEGLQKEQESLRSILAQAKKKNEEAVRELIAKFQEAQGEFESIAKIR